jgi:hypothetical protein
VDLSHRLVSLRSRTTAFGQDAQNKKTESREQAYYGAWLTDDYRYITHHRKFLNMPSSSLSLVGIAVIGKNNEPLYACDCTRHHPSPPDDEPEEQDVFGFLESARTGDFYQSLPIQHQFLVHAALDRLDELVHTTNSGTTAPQKLSGMPVRRKPNPSMGPHWLGVLLNVADEWQVHGYITATNIKFLALTTAAPVDQQVKKVLESVHTLFIRYAMNSFHDVRELGTIRSPRFDQGIREAVQQYYKESTLKSQKN